MEITQIKARPLGMDSWANSKTVNLDNFTILLDAMRSAGIEPPDKGLKLDGTWERWDKNSAFWFKGVRLISGHIVASFGDWRTGTAHTFRSWEHGPAIDPAEVQQYLAEHQRRKEVADAKQAQKKARRAKIDTEIWERLPEQGESAYLTRKGVGAHGVRFGADEDGPFVAVPLQDIDGTLRAFQRIRDNGEKKFAFGTEVSGSFHTLGRINPTEDLILAAGYASAATVFEATGTPTLCCFDAENLLKVADAVKTIFPGVRLIVASDHDQWKPKVGNTGVEAALAVARKYPGTRIAVPSFVGLQFEVVDGRGPTDFNDLAVLAGLDTVKMQLDVAEVPEAVEELLPPKPDPAEVLGLPPSSQTGVNGFALVLNRKGWKNGLHAVFASEDGGEPTHLWLCGPLEVNAIGRAFDNTRYAVEVTFTSICGARQVLTLPREQLLGDGIEAIRQLAGAGLDMVRRAKPLGMLLDFLHEKAARVKPIRIAEQTGWVGSVFVLPDAVFGASEDEQVVFRPEASLHTAYGTAGTLAQWQRRVAAPCIDNSRLILVVSTAFASMLLPLARQENGGVHLQGASSIGKTIALMVAASVFGHSRQFVENWRATDNALEAVALAHNDTLLILDELGQVDPRIAGDISYLLANGQGKSRGTSQGGVKERKRWRLLFLSSGELSLADHMQSAGKTAKAGQEVRLITVPADTDKFGLFENLHGCAEGAQFAHQLSATSQQFYGSASRAFLKQLVIMPRGEVASALHNAMAEFVLKYLPKGAEAQVGRLAERFALIAAAGELASTLGITGWPAGTAEEAVAICLKAAIKARGGLKQQEEIAALRQVRKFFEANGESRFTKTGTDPAIAHTQNRAGFSEVAADGSVSYYVFPESWRTEICKGFDISLVNKALKRRGYLEVDPKGKSSVSYHRPGWPRRLYHVYASILEGEADGEGE